ncbi:MAG: hypothetical protein AB1761_16740 [Pseudomonadota bacterium]
MTGASPLRSYNVDVATRRPLGAVTKNPQVATPLIPYLPGADCRTAPRRPDLVGQEGRGTVPYVLLLDGPRPTRWFSGVRFTRSRSTAVEFDAAEVEQRRAQLAEQLGRTFHTIEVGSAEDVQTSAGSPMAEGLIRNVLRKYADSRYVIRKEASGELYTGAGWSPYREDAAVCTGADVLDTRLRTEAATGQDIASDEIT